jgi:adenosine deaminase-related growth factor
MKLNRRIATATLPCPQRATGRRPSLLTAFFILTLAGGVGAASGPPAVISKPASLERATGAPPIASKFTLNIQSWDLDRMEIERAQNRARFCADEKLSKDEDQVDIRLKQTVAQYFQTNRDNPKFSPMLPFYAAKRDITGNKIYTFLRAMPKGAMLHAHLTMVGRMDWVIAKALSVPDCQVKWNTNNPSWWTNKDGGTLKVLAPGAKEPGYVRVSDLVSELNERRARREPVPTFEDVLRARLTFDEDNAGPATLPWGEFFTLMGLTGDFIREESLFEDYLVDAFETLWKDGVYYVELRDSLGPLRQRGTKHGDDEQFIARFESARKTMQNRHRGSGFGFDCRIIYAGFRGTAEAIMTNLQTATNLWARHQNVIEGFDLIGEEHDEKSRLHRTSRVTMAHVIRQIDKANDPVQRGVLGYLTSGSDFPFYLHDGESAWGDNDNLIDAALLRPKRIGHAFNLFRFPSLYEKIKANDIALEICPISNQLLGLTPDLRTHPAAGYLNAGIQCVLASDDPLFFGNDGLSYDYWEALTAWGLDLAALKKLARNSIKYSGLGGKAKDDLMGRWQEAWDAFIKSPAAQLP